MMTKMQAPPVRRITFPSSRASMSPATLIPKTCGNAGVGEFAGGTLPSRKLSRTTACDRPVVVRESFLDGSVRSEEHTSELQSRPHLVCRLLLEKKKKKK